MTARPAAQATLPALEQEEAGLDLGSRKNKVRLQLGCGLTRPANWINADSSLNSLLQQLPGMTCLLTQLGRTPYRQPAIFLDVRRGWQFGDSTVDVVYASHLFEHLTRKDGQVFLAEARRVLVSGGALRLVVPDLYALAKQYVAAFEGGDSRASDPFMHALHLHTEGSYGAVRNPLLRVLYWLQGYPHQHKYMYDEPTLRAMLVDAGFQRVRTGSYGRSLYIPEIADVESTAEGQPSIYLEARS